MTRTQQDPGWRVDPRLPQPAHEQIYRYVRTAIVSGRWPPGTLLPTVREMAARVGVHFNTVARAYRRLAREGWVTTRQGQGTMVRALSSGRDWRVEALEDLARRYVTQARWLGFSSAEVLAAVEQMLGQDDAADVDDDL